MRVSKTLPTTGPQLVETDTASRIFTWFNIQAVELGQLKYEGRNQWVDMDDPAGRTYKDAAHALVELTRRHEAAAAGSKPIHLSTGASSPPRPQDKNLHPGTEYKVSGYTQVIQERDRLVIRTAKGDVVIHLG